MRFLLLLGLVFLALGCGDRCTCILGLQPLGLVFLHRGGIFTLGLILLQGLRARWSKVGGYFHDSMGFVEIKISISVAQNFQACGENGVRYLFLLGAIFGGQWSFAEMIQQGGPEE